MDSAAHPVLLASPLKNMHEVDGATLGEWFGTVLPSEFSDWRGEYRFARESVAVIDKNYRAYLAFTGPDRVRYLNAIFTNDIKSLTATKHSGQGVGSLFLNPQGRIQAEIETYAELEKLFCVTFASIREQLIPALDHYIIMDDVTLTDESAEYATIGVEGPQSDTLVRQLTAQDLSDMEDLSWQDIMVREIPCRIVRRRIHGAAGWEFLVARGHLPLLWKVLNADAKILGGGPMGYTALNALRLEQGIPWFSYDFGEKQIPHEAGLENSHISYSKGCYTGQEIVERVRSRGQVNRVRAFLKIESSDPPSGGSPVLSDGQEVGFLTRSAFSPALNSAIAFAYLRREKSTPDSILSVNGASALPIAPPLAK